MIDEEQIQRYRKMTPGERLREPFRLTQEAVELLNALPADEAQRILDREWADKDKADQRMLDHLWKCREACFDSKSDRAGD